MAKASHLQKKGGERNVIYNKTSPLPTPQVNKNSKETLCNQYVMNSVFLYCFQSTIMNC